MINCPVDIIIMQHYWRYIYVYLYVQISVKCELLYVFKLASICLVYTNVVMNELIFNCTIRMIYKLAIVCSLLHPTSRFSHHTITYPHIYERHDYLQLNRNIKLNKTSKKKKLKYIFFFPCHFYFLIEKINLN